MMGVFGTKKLQDDVFCLTQERDFFQSRYLEQVSQIQDMKQEMESYRKEINRLRLELLNQSAHSLSLQDKITEDIALRSMTIVAGTSPENESETASKTKDEEVDGDEREVEGSTEDDAEALDIRQNAAKLLQWADYRTTVRTSPAKETKEQNDEDSATESYSESDRSAGSVDS
jgi:hypothetical protein